MAPQPDVAAPGALAPGGIGHARQSEISPIAFHSILFQGFADAINVETAEAPACFHDLNLDQIVAAVTAGSHDYDLGPFFNTPLHDCDAIVYRQEIMQDLERAPVMQAVKTFADTLRTMRGHLKRAQKIDYRYEKERWFLNAVAVYCDAVNQFLQALRDGELSSRGMRAFRNYLALYTASSEFGALVANTRSVTSGLSTVRYSLLIRGRGVTTLDYADEADYSAAVEQTFEKFRRGAVKNYSVRFSEAIGLNHVEAQILERVALLNPNVFHALDTFCVDHAAYLDPTVSRFEREIQFYVAYLTYIETFTRMGLSFCYPQLSQTSKEMCARDSFDLALAGKLIKEKAVVVRNDFFMHEAERIFVVSGPNQGGKTTFARAFGQVHYLASLGCAVPGTQARLFLFDMMFTHFERAENIETLRGKLQDDLVRIRHILDKATSNSIIIMNEMFSSTTVQDAVDLSRKVMATISRMDLLCVWVTFLSELASFDGKTVSLVGAINPDDPAIRTYKVERRPADGLAYALAIAQKHRLTYDYMKERIRA